MLCLLHRLQSILAPSHGRALPAGLCHRIMQSFQLTKTLWIIKSNHKPKTAESTTCHQLSFLHGICFMGLSPSHGSKFKATTLSSPSRSMDIKHCQSTSLQQTSDTCSSMLLLGNNSVSTS